MSTNVARQVAPRSTAGAWTFVRLLPGLLFAILALFPILADLAGQGHWLSLVTRIVILGIAALSLDLILGIGGLVSFGHAAFMGLGAYVTGILIQEGIVDITIAVPVALLVCGLFGALTGAVSLRTKGVAFIMITLAFGQMAYFFGQSLYSYGGDDGLTLLSRSTVLGQPWLENRLVFYYVALATLLLSYLLVRALVASRFGRALRGARDNAVRMASLGYNVFQVRLAAYTLSGMICGLSGVLLANHTEFVSPAFMSWQRSGELIFMVIIGGLGSLWGAIVGAAAFLIVEESLAGLTQHWKAIFGPLIILFVLFTRGGVASILSRVSASKREADHG